MSKSVREEVLSPADYAAAIRELRGPRTQSEVAADAGMAPGHWNRLEKGTAHLEPATQAKVARGLGVTFERFSRAVLHHALQRLEKPIASAASEVADVAAPYDAADTRLLQVEGHVRASAENLILALRLYHQLSSAP